MTVRILTGHVLDRLADLPAESVNCVVTSPPYWGLRDYGTEPQVWGDGAWTGSLGLEPNYQLYVAHLVEVFEQIKRVLRADGVAWLNLGDSYCNYRVGDKGGMPGQTVHAGKQLDKPGRIRANKGNEGADEGRASGCPRRAIRQAGLKEKDLIGIPWRVAFALQDAGWWLRKDNIFHKRNPMPESVEDRTTTAHEYVFHLTKSERYWYDAAAIMEPFETDPRENYPARAKSTGRGEQGFALARGADRDKSGGFPVSRGGRNRRSVWTIATSPTPEAHFATMPEEIAEICILAGCPLGGVVLDPFLGSGTTARVADRLARDCIGIELQPKYIEMAERRTREPGFALYHAT